MNSTYYIQGSNPGHSPASNVHGSRLSANFAAPFCPSPEKPKSSDFAPLQLSEFYSTHRSALKTQNNEMLERMYSQPTM